MLSTFSWLAFACGRTVTRGYRTHTLYSDVFFIAKRTSALLSFVCVDFHLDSLQKVMSSAESRTVISA